MAKKNFTKGINILLGQKSGNEEQRNVNSERLVKKKHSNTRATFIIDKDIHDSIKAIAYWERLRIQDIVNNAFLKYIDKYEQINGKLKKPCDK